MGATYYVFGQDRRKVGAQTGVGSFPNKWVMGEEGFAVPATIPVPVHLDDPIGRGDSEPKAGAGSLGDIIDGAGSCYSTRLCVALKEFGIDLKSVPASIYAPGTTAPNNDYCLVLNVPDVACLIDTSGKLDNFEIDPTKTNGLHMFDVHPVDAFGGSARIIDEALKQHLEKLDLRGVYIMPTTEYGGRLKIQLRMG